MKSVSRIALGVALALGGASVVATAPAAAQKSKPAAEQPQQRQFKLSKEERAALEPLRAAVAAQQWDAALAALPAAQAAAQGTDAKYFVADIMLRIGLGKQDVPMQAQAIDAIIASGGAPAGDLPTLYRNQGALAAQAGNRQKAEAAFTKASELLPNEPEILIDLAKVKNDLRKPQEAVQLLERAIEVKKASGQPVHESWYKYALKLAFDGRMAPQSVKLSRALIAAYPTKENWRDALLIYRDVNTLDKDSTLDLLRLGRVSGALAGERDWYELAELLDNAALLAEAKAVLDEGAAQKMVDLNKAVFRDLHNKVKNRLAGDRASLPGEEAKAMAAANGVLALRIGDAWMGYGEYARSAALFRAAATKGGVDPNVANMRLGIALALGGDKAGAEAAFRSVTGARADVAAFWLAWLAKRA